MSEKDIKEINNLISMRRWEDALTALRRSNLKDCPQRTLKEALLLYNMNCLKECGDLCLESLEKKKNFDLNLILRACENLYRRRSLLIAPISEYKPADAHVMHSSVASLLAVFCDIREAVYYLNGLLAQKSEPLYKYLLAQLHRISGKIQDAINIAESISSYNPAKQLLEILNAELVIVQKRTSSSLAEKVELESMSSLSAEELMVRGFWSISERDYQLAFKYFGEAVKMDPSLAICWYYVGMLQNFHGAKDRGELCFKKFLDLFPQSSGFYRNQISSPIPGTPQETIENYYHRWIGYMPSDPRSWIAYLRYLCEYKDPSSVKLLASEILDNYCKDWFIHKDTSFYHLTMGVLRFCAGRLSSAEESFRTALKYDGMKSLALICLGKTSEAHGSAVDASDNYEKASVDENASLISKYLMTNVLLKKKNYKKAFSMIDEVLLKNRFSPIACAKKAEVFLELSDIKGLRKYLLDMNERSSGDLKADPSSPEMSVITAMISLRESKIADGIAELKKAMEQYPDSYTILKNLAILYFKSEQYKECISLIESCKVTPIDPELLFLKGAAEFYCENFDIAEKIIMDYLSLNPFDSSAWHLIAVSSFRSGKMDIAALAFEKAACYSGAKLHHRLNLSIFNAYDGKYTQALELMDISSALRGTMDNNYIVQFAWLQYVSGKYDDALETLKKIVKGKKVSQDVSIVKAAAEYAKGYTTQASATIDEAIDVCGETPELLYNRAFIALHDKNLSLAEVSIAKAIQIDNTFYNAWIAKAVLSWMNNSEEDVTIALKGAKKLKNSGFKEWLKKASSIKEPLSTISFYDKISLNFYMPEIFTLHYNDPLNIFLFEKLDTVFKK